MLANNQRSIADVKLIEMKKLPVIVEWMNLYSIQCTGNDKPVWQYNHSVQFTVIAKSCGTAKADVMHSLRSRVAVEVNLRL